ncbi:choice-of-anchor I family protein [Hufsiella ginkgonis]|uniref:T9SS type B sorting domain-containing protein n=1 Tax=Hufsiella ginkgonis TaxID=2695274 RepID=A0A7K1XZV2_9SPHI|nr:choice-of-anchor I family protein [Hufsiella ginkgonis]MXV16347.1 hypothetical protein [Hufsiella ginkgonis]
MKKTLLFLCLQCLLAFAAGAQTLLHYWNFNNSATEASLLTPNVSLVSGGSITHLAGTNAGFTSAIMITSNTTGQGFETTNPNARNGDAAGAHIRFNNPIGGKLVFAVPTTGYRDVIVKYATRRSGSGPYNQVVDYSLDGTTYTNLTTIMPVDGNPTLQTLDFTAIAGANNNPNFKIRIGFTQGGGGLEGNNRFDNFSLEGSPVPVNTLLHYWNFNNSATEASLLTPNVSLVSGGSITHLAGTNAGFTSAIMITSNTTGQGFETTNPNARNGDAAGAHIRFNNPIGGKLVFAVPTTGYRDVIVKYATRRSGSGPYNQVVDYSLDGTTYTNLTTIMPVDGNPTLQTLDFTAIAGANNNPNFKIRIGFTQGGGGLEGNNRFDNFSVEGSGAGSADLVPPAITFSPENNAVNVATNVQPTLTFNEDVRAIDNSAFTNTSVDQAIDFRLNDAAGTPVPFDATISGKVITVVPAAALAGNQKYYLALKANMVEDNANNAIAAVQPTVFTTLAVQTIFQPGDIVPVAYRMNASDMGDEIALLTLVNILPGTLINVTDAKYTDLVPAQGPGGLVWTAPAAGVAAGTVIRIQNDASTTNIGTLSGAPFGLSSSGDQAIVYTGAATAPAYVTALSSNAWVTANTSYSGSNSKLPAALVDGQSSVNLSAALGNTGGNTVNAYYNGTQTGTIAQLKAAILNPANWTGTASGTPGQTWPAFNFPGPPAVVSAKVLSQITIQLAFNKDLDPISAANLANFTGVAGLASVARTSNGAVADTLILTYTTPFTAGTNYSLAVNGIKDTENRAMFSAFNFPFSYITRVGFQDKFLSVKEDAGSVQVKLLLENPAAASVKLVLKPAPFSNTSAGDVTFTTQTLTFTGSSTGVQTINIPVVNDALAETDEYFVLSLEDLSGLSLSGKQYLTVYIRDDDRQAPQATGEIKLNYVSSFKPNTTAGSTTEIVVHDAASQRLFMTSAIQDRLDIADFSNPAAITLVRSIDMAPYGGITSVAVKNGVVAVASPAPNEQDNGSVVFFNINGDFQKKVTVGALPDMITFSPDGKKIMTANEGQPNDAYTVDPEGSISVIDISGGLGSVDQSKVTTLSFAPFNAQEAALRAAGVRKTKSTSTLAQDFEPEYITISPDSKKAWVTIQENNAIGEINLETNTITAVWPLGRKDFNTGTFGFDASDNSGVIHISSYPVKSFFMPDGIANFSVNGKTYLVSANEGDEKEYGGLNERTTVGAAALDPTVFPNAAVLKEEHNLGRLRITNLNGDTDGDGDFDELVMNGARSFSIWDADTKTLVYDSKDEFELFISRHPELAIFNADNEGNAIKSRSRAKGPEAEGVTVAAINGATYAFVTLERVGGVMVYNITDPANAKLVDYKNNRSLTTLAGDLGPEGVIYIRKEDSPDGKAYIAIANEISGNVSVFSIIEQDQAVTFAALPAKTFGDAVFTPVATSAAGTIPTYTSANPAVAVIENGAIRITGAGTAEITASFPAGGGYRATTATQALTVAKKQLTITAEDKSRVFGEANPAFTVTFTGFVNGNTSAVLTTQPAATTTAAAGSAVGTYAITPAGAAAANYTFTYTNGTLTVTPAVRTLTFGAIAAKTFGDADFAPGAVASTADGVSYSSSNTNVATIVNGQIHITGAGTSTITAGVTVNANYTTAPTATQVLTVNKAAQTISFSAVPVLTRGAAAATLQVTASSGLAVELATSNALTGALTAKLFTPLRIGTTVITATQPGNANYLPATAVTQTVTVIGAGGELVRIHGALSPDGDNINDFLMIEGAQNFPDNRVIILNKAGIKVFDIANYDNTLKVFTGRGNNNDLLPAGTYYCLLVYKDNGEQKRVTNYFVIRY